MISPVQEPVLDPVQEFFEADRVLNERRVDGQIEVLIKWLNYDEETWEPLEAIKECPHLLEEFRRRSGAPSARPRQQRKLVPVPSLTSPTSVPAPQSLSPLVDPSQGAPQVQGPSPQSPQLPRDGQTVRSDLPPPCSTRSSSVQTTTVPPSREGDPFVSFLVQETHTHAPLPVFSSLPSFNDILPDLLRCVKSARAIPVTPVSVWKPGVGARWKAELDRLSLLFESALANPTPIALFNSLLLCLRSRLCARWSLRQTSKLRCV